MAFSAATLRLSGLWTRPACEFCALRRGLPPLGSAQRPQGRAMGGGSDPRRFADEKSARKWASGFVGRLDPRERQYLRDAMRSFEVQDGGSGISKLTKQQIRQVFFYNAFPFIGFGFLDNGIMIVAGEYIDVTFGSILAISTMAAAALGNLVSDVCGIGLAGYVELIATRFGVSPPNITSAQYELKEARWSSALGRAVGVAVGCVLGMFPLLIFSEEEEEENEEEEEPAKAVDVNSIAKKT